MLSWCVTQVSKIVSDVLVVNVSPSWHTPWRGRTRDRGRPCWDGSHSPVLHWLSRTSPARRQQLNSSRHRWLLQLQPPGLTQSWPGQTWPTPANTFIIDHWWSFWVAKQVTALPLCDWTGLLTCYPTLNHIYTESSPASQPLGNLIFSLSAPLHYQYSLT